MGLSNTCPACDEVQETKPGQFIASEQRRTIEQLNERIDQVLRYCEPHLDKMWAAAVVGGLLDCDFRDADKAIRNRFQRE